MEETAEEACCQGGKKKSKKAAEPSDDDSIDIPTFHYHDKPKCLDVALQYGFGPAVVCDNPILESPFDNPLMLRQEPDTKSAASLKTLMVKSRRSAPFVSTDFLERKVKVIKKQAQAPVIKLSGNLIGETFDDGAMAEAGHFDFFAQCLMDDHAALRTNCLGYRIILPTDATTVILTEDYFKGSVYDENDLYNILKDRLSADQILKAKLIFIPVHKGYHWAIYCFNRFHGQIDILDPLEWMQQYDKDRFHSEVCLRIRDRVNATFKRITEGKSDDMSNWDLVFVEKTKQKLQNDSLYFCMMYVVRYDGFSRNLVPDILPDEGIDYRVQLLHYMMFHPGNKGRSRFPQMIQRYAGPTDDP